MSYYSVVAEFVGTHEEARQWAEANGLNYARRLGTSPNGLPHVSLSGRRAAGLQSALARFAALGWPRSDVVVRRG